jgi:2-polyprenyl-6-methoxyphenol hydroxylase-like FAD-dependent oxidoreductase
MMVIESEVLIVGGGMAGLALAAELGAQGLPVAVVDAAPLPRDKVCGEGLMPLGVDALRRLGLSPQSLPGAPFRGLEYRTAHQAVRLDFPPGAVGWGMRRTALIPVLDALARRHPSVSHHADAVREPIREGEAIVGVRGVKASYRAPVVIAADGVKSSLARRAGLTLRVRSYRMGLRRHFRCAGEAPPARVRVGLFPPHDVYLTPVGEGELLATTLTDRAGFRAIAEDYEGFLRQSPFAPAFREARPVSRQLGWYHPLFVPQRYHVGGMLLVGDAGGGADPCLGLGMSLALLTARFAGEAARAILAEPARRSRWVEEFDRQRRMLFRQFSAFDRVFHLAVRSGAGSELLLWAMRHWPCVAERILDIVATGRPWRPFPWSFLLRPRLVVPSEPGR